MSLQIGQPAPQFTMVSSEKKEVSLSDFKGKKVVLHFFPFAFTGTCTTQLCNLRDNFGYYDGLNAQILAVSVDSPHALAKFKEVYSYQFPCFPISIKRFRQNTMPGMKYFLWV